jgi:hypothetical protein
MGAVLAYGTMSIYFALLVPLLILGVQALQEYVKRHLLELKRFQE